jgi:transglutaminase-like putative cysteine protease
LIRIFCYFLTSIPLLAYAQEGILLDYHTYIKVSSNKLVKEATYLIQINQKEGDWLGEIEISEWGMSKVEILEAHILDNTGAIIRKVSKKEITRSSDQDASMLYSDSYVYDFSLKYNKYPYRIFYKYRTTYKEFFSITNWVPNQYFSIPTLNAELTVDIETVNDVNMHFPADFEYSKSNIENGERHIWKINSLKAIRKNVMSPPYYELVPKVLINPSSFRFGVDGSLKSWSDFGQWKTDLIKGLDDLPLAEIEKLKQKVAGINDKKEIIATIYKYLQQNHRYIYVGEDIGGFKPHPASYVVANRYGDCKALTNYMKSALASVGIESYYTTIYAGDNPIRVNPDLPGHQSNHAILCVPLEKDTVWLENTSNTHPFNYLGTFTQNRLALINNGANSKLIRTPALSESDVLNERKIVLDFTDILIPKGKIDAVLRGDQFEDISNLKINGSLENQKNYVQEMIPFNNSILNNWDSKDHIDPKATHIHLDFEPKNLARKLGNMYAIPLPSLEIPAFERVEKRLYPVRINYPIATSDTISFKINAVDAKSVQMPEAVEIESDFGKYKLSIVKTIDGGEMLLRNFTLKSGDCPLENYPAFYSFIDQIKQQEQKSSIIIQY